ncbi:MAG: type II secretion system F family protein [Bacteriovoracaceae bacterium]|nr:type II secretion system F family protein [Bacteriovoracaceae bacterium]
MLIILISVAGLYPLLSKFFKKRAVTKLQEEFDKSLGESLQILTSSLRAGLTLKAALTASIKSAPKVFADQMRITINDFNLGVPMDEALTRMKSRVNTPTTDLALGSMIITSRSGGDLASMLGKISLSINESERIQGKLRALTAQGKMQALLVSLAPPFLFIFMSFYDPERMNVLTETTMGQILLVTAVIFEVIGIIITKKVLKLKI